LRRQRQFATLTGGELRPEERPVNIREENGVTIVTMVPKFDAFAPRRDEPQLIQLVKDGVRALVCDFSGTTFISSSGLRVVHALAQSLNSVKGKFAVCGLSEPVAKVFSMAGFDKIIAIHPDAASAVAALSGGTSA